MGNFSILHEYENNIGYSDSVPPMGPGCGCIICCKSDYGRKTGAINTPRRVVWVAKASSAPRPWGARFLWIDGGYGGRLVDCVAGRFQFCLAVVLRPKQTKKFVLLPRRWVVERAFGWLNHSRRISKSYKRLTSTDETWIVIAITRLMLNRLA